MKRTLKNKLTLLAASAGAVGLAQQTNADIVHVDSSMSPIVGGFSGGDSWDIDGISGSHFTFFGSQNPISSSTPPFFYSRMTSSQLLF